MRSTGGFIEKSLNASQLFVGRALRLTFVITKAPQGYFFLLKEKTNEKSSRPPRLGEIYCYLKLCKISNLRQFHIARIPKGSLGSLWKKHHIKVFLFPQTSCRSVFLHVWNCRFCLCEESKRRSNLKTKKDKIAALILFARDDDKLVL